MPRTTVLLSRAQPTTLPAAPLFAPESAAWFALHGLAGALTAAALLLALKPTLRAIELAAAWLS